MPDAADVELTRRRDGSWQLDARDIDTLRSALGDLLLAFCRCFVHENRLLSFAHYRELIRQHAMDKVVSIERAKLSILWFEVGTIRELGTAIGELRKLLQQRGWMPAPGLDTLSAVEVRWRELEGHRNRAAFHVDPEVMALGLSRIQSGPLILMAGDGVPHHESWIPLGDMTLLLGMNESQAELNALVRTVVKDREAVLTALLHLFAHCVRRANLSYRQVDSG